MANYANIIAEITAAITTNDNEEITGAVLQNVLLDMMQGLGAGYQYKGIATAETVPGTPDERVFYLAGVGAYPNFDAQASVAKGYLGVFYYDGAWRLATVPVGGDYDDTIADINQALADLADDLEKTAGDLADLGAECFNAAQRTEQRAIGSSFVIGTPSADGSVAPTYARRAYYRFHTDAPTISLSDIPSGWFVALHLCNSSWAIIENKDWLTSFTDIDLEGFHYVQLVIKYGSAGTTDITEQMLASFSCTLTEIFPAGTFAPAAPMEDVAELTAIVKPTIAVIGSASFAQGTNDASGNVVSSTTRIISEMLDAPAGTRVSVVANGQKYVILQYSASGSYEKTTGWMTEDGVYDYPSAKKLRFLVAKLSNATIVPADMLATFTVTTVPGLQGRMASVEAKEVQIEANDRFNRWNKTVLIYNPYKGRPAHAYKGQLHCHTTNSDGTDAPATVVQKYIAAGYDFMTITDHNYITPDPNAGDIVWMGNSYEDTHNNAGYQHMNVYNADAVLGRVSMYETSNTPTTLVQHFVKHGNAVLSYNHPEYPAVYASDFTLENLPVGISLVEVFNGTIQTLCGTVASVADLPAQAYYHDMYDCTGDGKRYINNSYTYNSPNWQATTASANPDGNLDRGFHLMLDAGHKVFCNAVDDYHRGDNMFNRGWVVAFANERSAGSIWNAILNGCSYASTGVTLTDVRVEDGLIELAIADGESAVTKFIGRGNTVLATVSGAAARYQITGDEGYVRAMVTIGRSKAWTQPVWILGKKDQYTF